MIFADEIEIFQCNGYSINRATCDAIDPPPSEAESEEGVLVSVPIGELVWPLWGGDLDQVICEAPSECEQIQAWGDCAANALCAVCLNNGETPCVNAEDAALECEFSDLSIVTPLRADCQATSCGDCVGRGGCGWCAAWNTCVPYSGNLTHQITSVEGAGFSTVSIEDALTNYCGTLDPPGFIDEIAEGCP